MNPKIYSFRTELEGLRGVAILMVIGYHFFPTTFPGGYLGVDLFFVLSGFFIIRSVVRFSGNFRSAFSRFVFSRIRRILPTFLIVITLSIFSAILIFQIGNLEQFLRYWVASSLFIENFTLATDVGYFDAAAKVKPFLHLWSLGVEAQFYAFVAIFILPFRDRNFFIAIFIILGLISLLLYTSLIIHSPSTRFYHPEARLWQFFIGSLIFFYTANSSTAFLTSEHLRLDIQLILTLFGSIILILLCFKPFDFDSMINSILAVCAAACLMLNKNTLFKIILSNYIFRFFGRISFSLYLVHWPLLTFTSIYLKNDFV